MRIPPGILSWLIVLMLTVGAAPRVEAAERLALVVGMARYSSIPPLDNTVRDAEVISETLANIGFDVTTLIDVPLDSLRASLNDFAFRSETADLALIYFAGHGVEVQGENFLIPVDAAVSSNRDIQRQSVSLKDMLAAVDRARRMRIVILDSCRDNPFGDVIATESEPTVIGSATATRGGGGLAPPSPDRGTLVAFAARDGQVALDGEGENSPFARALVDNLSEPGLEISLMFRQVRDEVLAETRNLQEPHTYGSLPGMPYYIAGSPEERSRLADKDLRIAWSALRREQAAQFSALAEEGDTRAMMALAYMRLNPDGGAYDPADAVQYLERAAKAGSPEATHELARLYENGIGVAPDEAKAVELFKRAADMGFADAINDLGFLYHFGSLGLPQDQQSSIDYFERAAEMRHSQALFNLAAMIDDGNVPGKGPDEAGAYLYQALRAGSADVFKVTTERPAMFTEETRRALQRELTRVGFYGGAIDGAFGPGTLRAIQLAYGQ